MTMRVGHWVSYLQSGSGTTRWRAARITSVTDQDNLVLAIVNGDGSTAALNGGAAVARRTAATQTNVWRAN
jgi:hypothetical protein